MRGTVRSVTYRAEGRRSVGLLVERDTFVRPFDLPPEAGELGLLAVVRLMAEGWEPVATGAAIALADVALEAPIPRPFRNIFCVGKNYREHAREFADSGFDSSAADGAVPQAPIIFSKVPETVIGPGQPIRFDPNVSAAIDYEVELAVIIGRGGRGIRRDGAMAHVWGYTIINDVTARDVQRRLKQWLVGKSFDSFCPMGPVAVSADEIDLDDTYVRTWVNEELRQEANTRDLIFDVPNIIETISAGLTLLPGDVIATGTPAGVGIGFDPPRYLKDGDRVRLEITGIGTLENRVEAITA